MELDRDQILAMEVGFELDIEVANLMGFKFDSFQERLFNNPNCEKFHHSQGWGIRVPLKTLASSYLFPKYSTNPSAVHLVKRQMASEGFKWEARLLDDGQVMFEFFRGLSKPGVRRVFPKIASLNPPTVTVIAKTEEEAICKAALLARLEVKGE